MSVVNEKMVLNYYIEEMDKDRIQFLHGRDECKEKIKEDILLLRDAENMNTKVQAAKKLWKHLFDAAMGYIDPDKRGYDSLFSYFDRYVNFEELIFASDSFYRDHTLHCLWVYFLGEYILRHEEFNMLTRNMYEDIKTPMMFYNAIKKLNKDGIFDHILSIIDELQKVLKYKDSARCIASITHDLGYPLKKISKINKCIKEILPEFAINNYDEFNFKYSEIQQGFIKEFIDFMNYEISNNFSISSKNDEKLKELLLKAFIFDKDEKNNAMVLVNEEKADTLTIEELNMINSCISFNTNIDKDVSKYLRYYNDFEQYQHGIMSAFLLMKVVSAFKKIKLKYHERKDININNIDIVDIYTKQEILRAVSDHTSDGYQITKIEDISSYLILIDELEEFSRISRANQNRQYVDEFCSTDVSMKDNCLMIDFIFDNKELPNLDPERAFKDKCNRLLSIIDIRKFDKELKFRIRFIGRLPQDNNIYSLEIGNKYAKIMINDAEKNIPQYLKSNQVYSREEYAVM